MRRVNIITGINQRFNNIFGNGTAGSLTPWSIQQAMVDNFQRMGRAMLGRSTTGKVLNGLMVTMTSGMNVQVSPGVAVTKSGKIIWVQQPIDVAITGGWAGTFDTHLCLQYSLQPLSSNNAAYKATSVIGSSGLTEIVYDEYGASLGPLESPDSNIICSQASSLSSLTDDQVYIAKIYSYNSNITLVRSVMNGNGQLIVNTIDSQTLTHGDWNTIGLWNEVLDTEIGHSFNYTSGIYQATTQAVRRVTWGLSTLSTAWTTGQYMMSCVSKNNATSGSNVFLGSKHYGNGTSNELISNGSALVNMDIGDTLRLKIKHNHTSDVDSRPSYPEGNYFSVDTIQ